MEITSHTALNAFIDAVKDHLMARESENCLALGLLQASASGSLTLEEPLLIQLSDQGDTIGLGIRTNVPRPLIPRPLLLTRMPTDAAACLARHLHDRDVSVVEIQGLKEVGAAFSEQWSSLSGASAELTMSQGLYELREVFMPASDGGRMVRAEAESRPDALEFIVGFVRSVVPEHEAPIFDAERMLARHLAAGTLYFWQDKRGKNVSVAAQVRETPHGASISLVYTPPELRGRGYASRLVAQLSQSLLDGGKSFCNLFTDLTNPTSNRIYQNIGYRPIATTAIYRFTP